MCTVLSVEIVPAALGDQFFYRDARAAGLSQRQIYALRDHGAIVALGGGLYRRADADPANFDYIEITKRVPNGTLCLETALAHHGLLDDIVARTDIAVPRGSTRPRVQAPHRLHSFDPVTFDVGRELLDIGGVQIGIYNAERSIIDMIRLRHDHGPDQAWLALRRWLDVRGNTPARLLTLAKPFNNTEAPLRTALEIIL